jgi:hypothetical protein
MSMELHVLLSKSRLPDVKQWQAAIDALSFGVHLDPSLVVASNTGFVPAKFKGRDSGFEFDISPASDVSGAYPEFAKQFAGRDRAANFRWGDELAEMACALAASAALAKLADGVWFDPQEGACLDHAAAIEQAESGIAAAL